MSCLLVQPGSGEILAHSMPGPLSLAPLQTTVDAMNVDLHCLSLGAMLLTGLSVAAAGPDDSFAFSTTKYAIGMRTSFPARYEGRRPIVYRSTRPGEEACLLPDVATSACMEKFVGAVALVVFTVTRIADGKPAVGSIRELVTLIDQSPGMPDRAPFVLSIRLIHGQGTDMQVFGYDETPLSLAERIDERRRAGEMWRRFRQELYMDHDKQPFAVLEWRHSIEGIRLLRVDALSAPAGTGR